MLFTHILVHERRAAFALDIAAPVEFAVAALLLVGLELVVSPAAAHELAAIHAF